MASRLTMVALVCASLAPGRRGLAAQWQSETGPRGAAMGAPVGGTIERYLRAAAVAGRIAPLPLAARGLLPAEVRKLLNADTMPHPWRVSLLDALRGQRAVGSQVLLGINSSMPWGSNDGAMWQGRGVNAGIGGAAAFDIPHLTLLAAPAVVFSQNASFPLMPQYFDRLPAVVDPQYAEAADLPQRRGTRPETRFVPGESVLRLDAYGIALGLSTSSEGWGTGETFPAILGANAGGIPRLFAGTGALGRRIGPFGVLYARYVLGVLEQSKWSVVAGADTFATAQASGRRRLATGLSVSFRPGALPALEVGASRFYHLPWRGAGREFSGWSKPFGTLFSSKERTGAALTDSVANQLGSVFLRINVPAARLEASVEVLRDDYNFDTRDLVQEPENNGALISSVRVATSRSATSIGLLTIEMFDGDVRPIAQQRPQGALYTNGSLIQGHTLDGQLLGAPIGVGVVSGQRVAWERFTPMGSHRISVQHWRPRSLVTVDFEGLYRPAPTLVPKAYDWVYDVSVSTLRQRARFSRSLEVGALYAGVWQLRRQAWNVYGRASASFF